MAVGRNRIAGTYLEVCPLCLGQPAVAALLLDRATTLEPQEA
jgi:hypothetical protein